MNNKAFSLVELSIVLVILGLLTGGILGGQSLIHAAELRNITTEYEQWQIATNTFKGKYGSLPGDFNQATRFWGARGTCPAANYTVGNAPDFVQETCNGNNNGRLGDAIGTTSSENHEQLLFWQHLSNAELIKGKYNGRNLFGSTSRRNHELGENCPISRFSSSTCWAFVYMPANGAVDHPDHGTYFQSSGTNMFMLGETANNGNTPHWPNGAALTTEEVWNIDTKLDDGLPDKGVVRSNQSLSNCYHVVGGENQYNLSRTSKDCIILFLEQ